MSDYIEVERYVWLNATGFSRKGALITTKHGKHLFIAHSDIRDVCDRLHDLADQLDKEKEVLNNGY